MDVGNDSRETGPFAKYLCNFSGLRDPSAHSIRAEQPPPCPTSQEVRTRGAVPCWGRKAWPAQAFSVLDLLGLGLVI
jgi:hypothetical protein